MLSLDRVFSLEHCLRRNSAYPVPHLQIRPQPLVRRGWSPSPSHSRSQTRIYHAFAASQQLLLARSRSCRIAVTIFPGVAPPPSQPFLAAHGFFFRWSCPTVGIIGAVCRIFGGVMPILSLPLSLYLALSCLRRFRVFSCVHRTGKRERRGGKGRRKMYTAVAGEVGQ